MGTQYQDLFMRDHWSDDGTVPDTYQGALHAGPDVINRGDKNEFRLSHQQLIESYPDQEDQSNYNYYSTDKSISRLYVRAKNLCPTDPYPGWPDWTTAEQPKIYLRQMRPTAGYQISTMKLIPNENGNDYALLSPGSPGEICPGDQPFTLMGDLSWGSHFCLVATVVTELSGDPFPTEDFNDWQDFVTWVRDNPNVSWHNIYVNPNEGTFVQQGVVFANLLDTEQPYVFTASWELPLDTTVRVWADPEVDAGFAGFDMSQEVSGVPDSKGLVGGSFPVSGNFPAGFQTTIFLSITTPDGKPIPQGAWTNIESEGLSPMSLLHPSLRDVAVPLTQYAPHVRDEVLAAVGGAYQASEIGLVRIMGYLILMGPQPNPF